MASMPEAPTMVLIVREDLRLSSGKVAVQCAHAAVSCTLAARKSQARLVERWRQAGARKICLKVKNLSELQSNRSHLIKKINSINEVIKNENVVTSAFDSNLEDNKIKVIDSGKSIIKEKIDLDKRVKNIFFSNKE